MSNRRKRKREKPLTQTGKGRAAAGIGKSTAFLEFYQYQITNEPVDVHEIPEEIYDELGNLRDMCQENPYDAIEELENLRQRYPHVKQIYNYLTAAFSLTGQRDKCDEVVLETYRLFPDYLFAKTAYAELCMRQAKLDLVPQIFDSKYDLKLLYPERTVFHVTEAASLFGTLGFYFYLMGQLEQTKLFHESLLKVAPDNPFTLRLQRCLEVESITSRVSSLLKTPV